MPPDAPDLPAKFARLQQQMILTEVELMKLEDLRDELRTREAATSGLLRDLQRVTDQACAERDHLARHAAEGEAALRQTLEQLAREQSAAAELQARISVLIADLGRQKSLATELQAKLAAIESSATWRWTAPLRAIGRLFRPRA